MSSNVNADGDSEALPPTADHLILDASPQDANPSIQTSIPDIVCPRCGAKIKKRNGTKKIGAGIFQRYTCLNGHNFTDDSKQIN